MTTMDVIEELDHLIKLLQKNTSPMGHIGISLEAMALCKDYELSKESSTIDQLYYHPFYTYFQQVSNDMHTQYPLRKMTLLESLEGYRRYLAPKRAADDM